MFSRFENLEEKLLELEQKLADPSQLANQNDFRLLAKEHSHVTKLHELYNLYKKVQQELVDSKAILKSEDDEEMLEMIKSEIISLNDRVVELEGDLRILLLPKDPKDEKNILLEIRAGTGGDEAALFVSDLYRMYCRYAESKSWKVEVMSSNPSVLAASRKLLP